ncbi:MAG: type III pantothenate kinase [Alphaproteobacteria bacterium]|nr:type III pantothenate kinase [Alphaproteobacteria bacterium]
MLLAIDAGNTNIVFAVFDGEGALLQNWRLHTQRSRSADEYAVQLNQLFILAGLELGQVEDVIISSVVPDCDYHLQRLCDRYLKVAPFFVGKDNVPIKIDLPRPEEVGADRLVNALAVRVHYRTPAIVIDFGTATTFDVIDADGAYAGGVIAPGIHLSLEALHRAASKLPSVNIEKPARVTGKTTVQAMQSGLYWGYAGLIRGLLTGLKEENGFEAPLVLATGGLAEMFAQEIDEIEAVDRELTLKGLYEIYRGLKR